MIAPPIVAIRRPNSSPATIGTINDEINQAYPSRTGSANNNNNKRRRANQTPTITQSIKVLVLNNNEDLLFNIGLGSSDMIQAIEDGRVSEVITIDSNQTPNQLKIMINSNTPVLNADNEEDGTYKNSYQFLRRMNPNSRVYT